MSDAIVRGFIKFDTAHHYASFPAAAQAWIDEHYADIPPAARPARSDLEDFARFFSTYLEASFELVRNPGKRLHSPDDHCFCPMCSWLVDVPHLRTRKVGPAAKKRARMRKLAALHALAVGAGRSLSEDEASAILEERALREPIALVAYGRDLLERLRGNAGPETLVLWREFAWTDKGSPKKDFVLTADAIFEGEETILEFMRSS